MCGISGVLTTSPRVHGRSLVEQIVAGQSSRGPDASVISEFVDESTRVTLGHNRLSIIDLSSEANQPMSDLTGKLHVVTNGEVYNYLELRKELEAEGSWFRTKSDTEVVLEAYRAWGPAAFDRFIGMFAIALFDERTRELLLVRDRFGVKPVYYWSDGLTLAFASTAPTLAAWAGLTPDLGYVARGIRYRYYEDDSEGTQYVGLSMLEPSHLLSCRSEGGRIVVKKSAYYDIRDRVAKAQEKVAELDDSSLCERFGELLRSSCQLRLRSDVPVGISLSGGLDSSSIAALVPEFSSACTGFSYAHPDDSWSESPLIREFAASVGIPVSYVWASGRAELAELFWRTLNAQDAPFPHVSVMAQHAVFRAARAHGTKVLLGGQGGDEALMGYQKFYFFLGISILRDRRFRELLPFASALPFLATAFARQAGVFLTERRRYGGSRDGLGTRLRLPASKPTRLGLPNGLAVRERQILDVTRYSLPTLLRYEDRNSMGNAVESRLPFLDHRVMEFALALPERLKLHRGFGKWILRRVMEGRLPGSIRLNRQKRGFDVDQSAWMRQGLGDEILDALQQRRSSVKDWLPGPLEASFGQRQLEDDPQAFTEAVTLIWLSDRC